MRTCISPLKKTTGKRSRWLSRCIVRLTTVLLLVITGVPQAPSEENKDGSIDTTFGTSTLDPGRVLTDFRRLPDGSHSNDIAYAIAIQDDGKIVAAGISTSPNGDYNFALVRYNNTPE